jgi:hypothetical protein
MFGGSKTSKLSIGEPQSLDQSPDAHSQSPPFSVDHSIRMSLFIPENGKESITMQNAPTWGDNSHSAKGPGGQNQGVPEGVSVGYTGS